MPTYGRPKTQTSLCSVSILRTTDFDPNFYFYRIKGSIFIGTESGFISFQYIANRKLQMMYYYYFTSRSKNMQRSYTQGAPFVMLTIGIVSIELELRGL